MDAAVFREKLEGRLEEHANGDRWALALARERVVADRLLARLVAVAPGDWSVTGPLALDLAFLHCSRILPTLEIEWRADRPSKFKQTPQEVAARSLGDHFEFELERCGMGFMGGQVLSCFEARAFVAGEPFATSRVDFHLRYGEISTEPLRTYDLLEFAGVEPVEVPAVLLELRVAEILRDYVSREGRKLDISEAADLVDLGEIVSRTHFHAFTLREAIRRTFDSHRDELPESLPRPAGRDLRSREDAETFREIAERAGAPTDLYETYEGVAALFDPILGGDEVTGVWDAYLRRWVPGRPENGHEEA